VASVVERRRAGDALAVPNPIDLINRRAPAHVAALEASCLRCLCEVVALAARSKVAPDHLEQMQSVALDNLRRNAGGCGLTTAAGCSKSTSLPSKLLSCCHLLTPNPTP